MSLYIVVMICAASLDAPCTPATARAYQAMRAPPGIIICGAPASLSIVNTALAPTPEREYIRTRCELRRE